MGRGRFNATSSDEPAAARLGRYASSLTSAPLADKVEEKAATCLLDGLALGIAAVSDPTTTALLCSPLIAKDPGSCSLWPSGTRVSLGDAVAVNGFAVHARFQDDCDMTSWSHPGSLILPAAISVGESVGASLVKYIDRTWLNERSSVGARPSPAAPVWTVGYQTLTECERFAPPWRCYEGRSGLE